MSAERTLPENIPLAPNKTSLDDVLRATRRMYDYILDDPFCKYGFSATLFLFLTFFLNIFAFVYIALLTLLLSFVKSCLPSESVSMPDIVYTAGLVQELATIALVAATQIHPSMELVWASVAMLGLAHVLSMLEYFKYFLSMTKRDKKTRIHWLLVLQVVALWLSMPILYRLHPHCDDEDASCVNVLSVGITLNTFVLVVVEHIARQATSTFATDLGRAVDTAPNFPTDSGRAVNTAQTVTYREFDV